MTEEQKRLSERLVWPIILAGFSVCCMAFAGAWAIEREQPIAALFVAGFGWLLFYALRLRKRWKLELAEYVPPSIAVNPNAPILDYREPATWGSRIGWGLFQVVVFAGMFWVGVEQKASLGVTIFCGVTVAAGLTGIAASALRGIRSLFVGKRGLTATQRANERISEARSLRGDRPKLPNALGSSQERLR